MRLIPRAPVNCPWCGAALHRDDDGTWTCIEPDGPWLASGKCALRGETLTREDIERTEIALIDAEME